MKLRGAGWLVGAVAVALLGCGGSSEEGASGPAQASAPAPSQPSPPTPPPGGWWKPTLDDSWQIQLSGTVSTTHAVTAYDIDLFDTPVATIAALKAQGRRVICYFSAGSSEDWRGDFSRFLPADMGNNLDGWPGERWLDTRSTNVRAIMAERLDLARSKGCDAVDPDNVDGYTNATGKPLTASTQLDYNRWLADQSHARGLSVGLKNDVDQLSQLASSHDFAINEQCHQYNECIGYSAFISLGKPVFNIEYAPRYVTNTNGARDTLCTSSATLGINTQVLPMLLDGSFRISCL